jgi:hypothetical protein
MAACSVCGGGKAKRHCPALGQVICATCCGTKRQGEIRCPADCGWLRAAQAHPHAARQRQQEQDAALVLGLIGDLDDEAYAVLLACLPAALQVRAETAPAPWDADLEAAAAALAATAETAARGVLYEHQPDSPVAARLMRAMSAPLADAATAGIPRLDAATATAMRRLAERVREVRRAGPGAPDAYFAFLARALAPRVADANTGQVVGPGGDPLLEPLAGGEPTSGDGPRIVMPW